MGNRRVRKVDGLKTIYVPCMKCTEPVTVFVSEDFKGRMRKFCPLCMAANNRKTTIYDDNLSDGCRQVHR
jgi:hypothetical protein